ncbi:MAG TPA: hypothetical protein VFN75_04020 [Pseudonocardiaceae bacterium]|nr:hypothetical protein [Pseudonocardiaceae bacterium]
MVVEQSMTVADVVAKAADGSLDEFLKNAVAFFVRELMESEIVRHEALLDRSGCETPARGRRSDLGKLRAAWTQNRGRGWKAALTTTGRAGTIGRCGPGKRDREA